MKTHFYKFLPGILIAIYLSSVVLPGAAFATPQQVGTVQSPPVPQEPKRGINPETGKVSFIGAGDPINVPGVSRISGIAPQDRALGLVNAYGTEFGLRNPARELKLLKSRKDGKGNDVVHYQQTYMGVPVIAGEMIINMNANGELLSISGEVSSNLTLNTTPAITAQEAEKTALAEIAKLHQLDQALLTASSPELWIFDESLLTASMRPVELVWRTEVTATDSIQPVREMVLVNAQTGGISFHVNQVHTDLGPVLTQSGSLSSLGSSTPIAAFQSSTGSRRTYTASGGVTLPGTLLCDETRSICTNGADPDADKAHQYAADTFVFYNTHHGRNSFDNLGGTIVSTVHYGVGYQNAFWDGSQMVYGDGMVADDVVGHEITHGVTQYTSNLIYSYQSGAINESFSDVWGEFIDQTNGSGNDSLPVKWLMGEDTPLGAIRSMSDPTLFGDPDKMSSPYYYNGPDDNGGVHWNSGVNNKAAYLMTDGGTFNGRTITGIGLNKTAAVYYEVQVHLLTAGANYSDLYYALVQGCQNLIGGANGITQSDCDQVRTAAEAVEMVIVAPPTPTPTSTPTSTPPASSNPLYISLVSNQTIGGVASADEDILRFDGTNWSLFFDGSDVGVGVLDLLAFSIVDADTILMSFNANVTVNGIAATPQDVLRFDATSLGSTTAGAFSLYFDGSDVGFDDATNEKIDALSLLSDGRLLISTTGNPVVPGVSGGRDEDVLAFTPTSLGDVTSGTWALYFDGSDVGLAETSAEDVDALDVVGVNIYLSTQGDFSVNGLLGADEDVFVCAATSIGDVTACNYLPNPYFDGSTWGLTANDVDAFHFLGSGPVPTVAPTSTPGATNTPTPTATGGPASTPTYTPTATPASPGSTFTFTPVADAYVNASLPASNYGSSTTLRADASPDVHSYLRFTVQGLSGTVTRATLRLFANSASSLGYDIRSVSDNTWSEGTLDYNNAPVVGGLIGSSGAIAATTWTTVDVTSYITGNGAFNLALTTPSSTAMSFASREAGANAPQLVIETQGGSAPTATFTPTATSPSAPTATWTPTPTATSLSAPTATPTNTSTAVPGTSVTFLPVADSYVNAGSPTSNYGSLTALRADASPDLHSYLRFEVLGLSGTVTKATLRIYANSASSLGCTASSVGDNTWSEAALNYNNAPPVGSALGSSGAFGAGAWINMDVTADITGNGTYSLALTTASGTAISFASRETGANAPQLIIETIP